MLKKIFFVAIVALPILCFSQQTRKQKREAAAKERREKLQKLIKQEEEGALVFNKQSMFGFHFNTDGFGMMYEKGKYKSLKTTNIWWLNLGERHHPKEEKLTTLAALFNGSNPYKFGKQNNFYYFKVGFGQQKTLGTKSNKNGVAVSAVYGGGLSLGMLRPYYLRVVYPTTGQQHEVKYTGNDSVFLNANQIIGAGSFGKGFGEMKFVPGFSARGAFRFDYGRLRDLVSVIEVGLNLEYYTQTMPIMLLNKEQKLFINAYVNIGFGSRK